MNIKKLVLIALFLDVQLKGLASVNNLDGSPVQRASLTNFDDVKNFDKVNEKMPTRRPK